MPKVCVRHFAMLREHRGQDTETVEVAQGTTASQLFAQLFGEGPVAGLPVAFAVNHERVSGDTPLMDSDEVAFLPPVGGG